MSDSEFEDARDELNDEVIFMDAAAPIVCWCQKSTKEPSTPSEGDSLSDRLNRTDIRYPFHVETKYRIDCETKLAVIDSGQFDKKKSEGNRYFEEGKFELALDIYTELLSHYSQETEDAEIIQILATLSSNRAACFDRLGETKSAIHESLHRRAGLYEKTEKLDEAHADLLKLMDLKPNEMTYKSRCYMLEQQINERNEKMKKEMMSQLKGLGNAVLKPFGLSTDSFKVEKDPNTGSYSISMSK
ncbi:hypothetical protein ACOME3_003619 [Neoechinorhynchus agilis]